MVTEGITQQGELSIFLYGEKEPVLSTVQANSNFPEIESSNFLPAVYEKLLGTPVGTRLVITLPPQDAFKYMGVIGIIPRNSFVIMVFDLNF